VHADTLVLQHSTEYLKRWLCAKMVKSEVYIEGDIKRRLLRESLETSWTVDMGLRRAHVR